jgi:cyclopropane-fatty-acyl-phospholipid synthase
MNIFKKLLERKCSKIGLDINNYITVHNKNLYKRIFFHGSLGLGESYMEGWWDCEKIDELIFHFLRANFDRTVKGFQYNFINYLKAKFVNLQKKSKAFEIGEKHYDRGNELFENMLDKRMIYSCAYWKDANNLDEAQENKLNLICKKVGLKEGMRVLDIGCGWGGFLKFASEKYNVSGVGITVSKEQAEYAKNKCKDLPIEIRLTDYRNLKKEQFDAIISIGMFEHVGYKNYRKFMKVVDKLLKEEGLFLLHTIGTDTSMKSTDPWINKYIFPNGMLPSPYYVSKAVEGIFKIEDWHNFGVDYDKTLMCWYENFDNYWKKKYGDENKFYRMWKYYLLSCAGAFRARNIHVWQIVFSKNGIIGGYHSIR